MANMTRDEKAALRRMRIEQLKDDAPDTGRFINAMVILVIIGLMLK